MKKNFFSTKIIIIFVVPCILILFFSFKTLYEKYIYCEQTNKTAEKLHYIKNTHTLISSLQNELLFSIISLNLNNKELISIRNEVSKNFKLYIKYSKSYLKDISDSSLELIIKHILNDFYILDEIRSKVDKKNISLKELVNYYTKTYKRLLNSIFIWKKFTLNNHLNKEYSDIRYFLLYKESNNIEDMLIIKNILKNSSDEDIKNELSKIETLINHNLRLFKTNSSIEFLDLYNKNFINSFSMKYEKIKKNILFDENLQIDLKDWLDIVIEKNTILDSTFEQMITFFKKEIDLKIDAVIFDKNINIFYFILCFATLLSLFFILRKTVLSQESSYDTIEKQKKVHELLNQANKQLLKKKTKSKLYHKINKIISKDSDIVFSFVVDIENEEKKLYAADSKVEELIKQSMENFTIQCEDSLLNKVASLETNVLIKDFSNHNNSIFSEDTNRLGIKSAALFPIKEFDKIVSVLCIYSNKVEFFDYEVKILFNQLTFDLTYILEKINYEELKKEQEEKLKTISVAFESSEPMLITDKKAKIVEVNNAFCEYMKYTKDELLGKNPKIFKSSEQNKYFYEKMWSRLKNEDSWFGDLYNKKADGTSTIVRLTITVIRNNNNEITNYLAQYIDISEIKNKEQLLEHKATHDDLTGLPNRLLLFDRIEHALSKIIRQKTIGGLIFIDIDNFKLINDKYGHSYGDLLLVQIAKKIKFAVREEDTVSRLGGDEFVILVDEIADNVDDAKKNILTLAEKVKETLNTIKYVAEYENLTTPSIGITLFDENSTNIKSIIKQANTAMYLAKKQGKNCIEFFS